MHSHVIIACLAAFVFVNPTQVQGQFQVIQAQADMDAMADAMELAAIETGRFVSLENLDDTFSQNATFPFNAITDKGGPFSMIPDQGFFLGRGVPFNWNSSGYVIYQQNRIQLGTGPYDVGSPLDPWNHPYLLFNPLGLIRGDQGVITQEYYGDFFDRYTIVSLGPDNVMGGGNDIIWPFNGTITGRYLTSLRGPGVSLTSLPAAPPTYDVEAGTTLTLRGFNFGPPADNKKVIFGAAVLQDVESWANREIVVRVPDTLSGTDVFRVQVGSTSTNGLQATITGSHTRVDNWDDY